MKTYLLPLLLIMANCCHAQQAPPQEFPVTSGAQNHDAVFGNQFMALFFASLNSFVSLPRQFIRAENGDSVWVTMVMLHGAQGDTIFKKEGATYSKQYFALKGQDGLEMVRKIKSALPPDFFYSVTCNDATGCEYRFYQKVLVDGKLLPSRTNFIQLLLNSDYTGADMYIVNRK